jgi:hypothetical protein
MLDYLGLQVATMADVFISYSHVDSDLVDEICSILDESGVEYFRDIKNSDWGDSINQTVNSGLKDAVALLLVLSPASVTSQWVAYETGRCVESNKKILPFLQHPSVKVPGFIGGDDTLHINDLDSLRSYFQDEFDADAIRLGSHLCYGPGPQIATSPLGAGN